jgi:hypothetical protein
LEAPGVIGFAGIDFDDVFATPEGGAVLFPVIDSMSGSRPSFRGQHRWGAVLLESIRAND